MLRGPAFVNKIVKKKQQDHEMNIHYTKLNQIKAIVNTNEPSSLRFPLLKAKQRQI